MLVRNICILSTGSPHTSSNTEASFAARSSSSVLLTHTQKRTCGESKRRHSAVNLLFLSLHRRGASEPTLEDGRGGRTGGLGYRADQGRGGGESRKDRWMMRGGEKERKGRKEGGSGCCRSRANVIKQYVWSMSKSSNPNACTTLRFYFFFQHYITLNYTYIGTKWTTWGMNN